MNDSSAWAGRDELLAEAARRARRYVDNVDRRPVAPILPALAGLNRFDEPLPEHSSDPLETLSLLDEAGSDATVATTGPRYFGFVNGGTLPIALASGWLGMAWDQNAALIGLGRDRLRRVPADDQGRMRAELLPHIEGPVIVCAQAGEVNTGAFDPFPQIVTWAREHDAWLHVDGAFGMWALADPPVNTS